MISSSAARACVPGAAPPERKNPVQNGLRIYSRAILLRTAKPALATKQSDGTHVMRDANQFYTNSQSPRRKNGDNSELRDIFIITRAQSKNFHHNIIIYNLKALLIRRTFHMLELCNYALSTRGRLYFIARAIIQLERCSIDALKFRFFLRAVGLHNRSGRWSA
jgi:hypothetical protein